jgi:hypothetical protein
MADPPLDWESAAAVRAPHIGIAAEKLLAARDLVRGAMGTAWFEREERRLARPSANIAHAHPLFRQLTSPNDPALVDVAELAFYLTALRDDPSIGEIIKDLRGGKFWATLFELAMAYRWQDAGAQVRLAPVTAKGKADFYATISGTELIVEVSRFEDDDLAGANFNVPFAVTEAALRVVPESIPFVCKVRVAGPVEPQLETPLRRGVKATGVAFVSAVQAGDDRVTNDDGVIEIAIEQLTNDSEDIPSRVDDLGRMVDTRDHDWNVIFRIPGADGGERARFFIHFENSPEVFSDEILAKVKKEVDQLSRTPTPSVVMIDLSRYGDLEGLPFNTAAQGLHGLMRQHARLTSVWFFARLWTTAFRHKYQWTHLENPYCTTRVPENFFDRLIMREWKWDFLAGREYATMTEEEAFRHAAAHAPPRPDRFANG